MRGPRKKAKEQSIKDQVLLKKASLNMKLLPETETDGKMASLLRLKSSSTSEEKEAKLRENITEESIFTAQWDTFTNFISINRSSRRKRGMASNPLFIIPDFFLHFPNKLIYGYLRFEGNGKIPLGR